MLGACQTTTAHHSGSHSLAVKGGAPVDTAIKRAAHIAKQQGAAKESLVFYEQLYRRNPQDVQTVLHYTSALRKDGQAKKAKIILQAWHENKTSREVMVALAQTHLSLGEFEQALPLAERAVDMRESDAQAQHVYGLTLDALGYHEQAEAHLREALESWPGDPVKVLNNLALNLSAQQKKAEALDIIDKALIFDPYNKHLHNNRALIAALKTTPRPSSKPNG